MGNEEGLGMGQGNKAGEVEWVMMRGWHGAGQQGWGSGMGDDEGLGVGQGSRAGEVGWVMTRVWAWGRAAGLGKWTG